MDDEWKRVHSSWKEGGCSCKTFDEHKDHLNYLTSISDRAGKIQEKFRSIPQIFLEVLERVEHKKELKKPVRPHLRLIIGGKK